MYKALKTTMSLMMVREAQETTMKCGADFAYECKDIASLAQESFHVITLNQKNKIIDRYLVSLGSLTATLVHPREVLRPAILDAAAAICVIHNHPSGDPTPSADDVAITTRIKDACVLMGIRLLDHVIIGNERYYSFVDEGGL